jgi:ribosomal subunit interface protein
VGDSAPLARVSIPTIEPDAGTPFEFQGKQEVPVEYPVQITFHGLEATDAIKRAVEERAEKLDRFYDKIESCRVVVDSPHKHQQKGRLYQVKVHLVVPGEELVVSRESSEHAPHEDLYLAINDGFKEMTRRLEDYVRRRRRLVKTHETPAIGRVVRLFPERGYGFIATADGREIYFHRNAVLDDGFDKLAEGAEVRFAEESGDKGPQASTVVAQKA